jgi:hypothetical protein
MKWHKKWLMYIAPFFIINWGQNNSVEGRTKHKLNFFGTVTTVQDKSFPVENISIARLFQNIPVYEVPTQSEPQELTSDPRKGIVSKLDLSEIARISVPAPHKFWMYKTRKGLRNIKFILINVISKDPQQTERSYIIETNRNLMCDEKNDAGPIEKIVPLPALKTLTIDGYHYRDRKKEQGVDQVD